MDEVAAFVSDLVAAERSGVRGPLRDHRPLMCNADDFLRMVNVPQVKGTGGQAGGAGRQARKAARKVQAAPPPCGLTARGGTRQR